MKEMDWVETMAGYLVQRLEQRKVMSWAGSLVSHLDLWLALSSVAEMADYLVESWAWSLEQMKVMSWAGSLGLQMALSWASKRVG